MPFSQAHVSLLRRAVLLCVAVLLLGCPLVAEELIPGYEWLEVGEGIYLSTRTDPFAGPIDGNSTVIVTDRDVVVVDSHIDPAAARAVIARIRELTPKPVRFLVNTHWHDDHTNGNQAYREAFPGLEIVSHPATLEALEEKWPQFLEDRRTNYERAADRDLLAMADEVEANDPQRAIGLRVYAGYRDALLPELGALEPVYPTLTTDGLRLDRGARTIEILWLGPGNTAGDLVVWLPAEKIVVTGDLVVHPVPYAFDAPMKEWPGTLRRLLDLGAETVVPGHGRPLTGTTYVEALVGLVEGTVETVAALASEGATLEQIQESTTLEELGRGFAGSDPVQRYSWESYYRLPGLESAWKALQD